MNVGYYPIKESEIKDVMKMILYYNKKDFTTVNSMLEKYNINEEKKNNIYASFEECLKNKNNLNFNESFGVCIAKVQNMFRGNFIFNDKSITNLMQMFPMLSKYKSNMGEIIKFKNNKYEFLNELRTRNSSGIYISYENIDKLYNDYYLDINTKKVIDNYYGIEKNGQTNKFIEVLDYCLQNKCGLLEADFLREKDININNNLKKEQVNSESIIKKSFIESAWDDTQNKTPKKIVSVANKTWSILGFRILWEIAAYIILSLITTLFLSRIESLPIKLTLSIIISLITTIIIWQQTIKSSFRNKTIEKNKLSKLMLNITLIMSIFVAFNIYSNYRSYNVAIDTMESQNITLKLQSRGVQSYGTEQEKQEYRTEVENAKKEAKRKVLPYYIISSISNIVVNLGVLPYVKKKIERNID